MSPRPRQARRRARRRARCSCRCAPRRARRPPFARMRGVAARVGNVAGGAALGVALMDAEKGRRELLRHEHRAIYVAERHAARREAGAAVRAHLERKRARAPTSTSGASAPLAAALRRHRRRQELQREDNIKAFMSVVSTQAIGSSTATYTRALARSVSSIASPSTGRQGPSLFLYCALTTPHSQTANPSAPPAAHNHSSSPRFLVFLLSCMLARTLAHWLSHARKKQRWYRN